MHGGIKEQDMIDFADAVLEQSMSAHKGKVFTVVEGISEPEEWALL